MKIACILVAYQAEEYLNSCLASWLSLKHGIRDEWNNPLLPPAEDLDIRICAVSALFKEYADLFNLKYDNEKTAAILREYEKSAAIDKFIEIKEPILDFQSRVAGWNYLKEFNPDILIELDADEIYQRKEIIDLLKFVERNAEVDFYKIRFRNYVGSIKEKRYVENFCPVRVIRNDRNGGIKTFYWDNDIEFQNNVKTPACAGLTIPKNICFPDHKSWCHNDTENSKNKIKRKIKYQNKALGACSYIWNESADCLELNPDYYKRLMLDAPESLTDLIQL